MNSFRVFPGTPDYRLDTALIYPVIIICLLTFIPPRTNFAQRPIRDPLCGRVIKVNLTLEDCNSSQGSVSFSLSVITFFDVSSTMSLCETIAGFYSHHSLCSIVRLSFSISPIISHCLIVFSNCSTNVPSSQVPSFRCGKYLTTPLPHLRRHTNFLLLVLHLPFFKLAHFYGAIHTLRSRFDTRQQLNIHRFASREIKKYPTDLIVASRPRSRPRNLALSPHLSLPFQISLPAHLRLVSKSVAELVKKFR